MIHARRAERHTDTHTVTLNRATAPHTGDGATRHPTPPSHIHTRTHTRCGRPLDSPQNHGPDPSTLRQRTPTAHIIVPPRQCVDCASNAALSPARGHSHPGAALARPSTHTHINTHNGVPSSNRLSRTRQPIPFNSRGGGGGVRRGGALCDGTALSAHVSRGQCCWRGHAQSADPAASSRGATTAAAARRAYAPAQSMAA